MNATTDTTIETGCLQAFLASGDVGHLLPLADHFAETDREGAADTVRRVIAGDVAAGAVRFFVQNGRRCGHGVANWLAGAVEFADVEAWFDSQEGAEVFWAEDDDADRSWMDDTSEDDERPLWYCNVTISPDADTATGTVGWVLGGINIAGSPHDEGFNRRDPYCRVVEAELKSKLYARLANTNAK
jgi:hypothetical protein